MTYWILFLVFFPYRIAWNVLFLKFYVTRPILLLGKRETKYKRCLYLRFCQYLCGPTDLQTLRTSRNDIWEGCDSHDQYLWPIPISHVPVSFLSVTVFRWPERSVVQTYYAYVLVSPYFLALLFELSRLLRRVRLMSCYVCMLFFVVSSIKARSIIAKPTQTIISRPKLLS